MRYIEDDHHRIVPDRESAHAYFSAMRLDELEREQMLTDDDDLREGSVVALIERRSGFVLPLPANSAVSWMYFGDGSGVEVFVLDGISLHWQMDTYPEYFDPDSTLNEDDVELDIGNCLDLIEKIQGGFEEDDDHGGGGETCWPPIGECDQTPKFWLALPDGNIVTLVALIVPNLHNLIVRTDQVMIKA